MSLKSNMLLNSIKKAIPTKDKATRMAKVTQIQNGSIYLTFYGETTQSNKPYKALSSYQPALNDTVILQNVGNSYVIIGKVV